MRYLLLSTLIFIGFTSFGQQSVKGGMVAYDLGNYDEAISILSIEMEHPELLKEKDRASGWYYLGSAKKIVISNAMRAQNQEALKKYKGYDLDAYSHLKKALNQKSNENLKDKISADIQSLSYVIFNSGNFHYLAGENENALEYYAAVQEIAEKYGMRNDYQVYQYKAQTQLALGDSTSAYDNYKKAILRYNAQMPEVPDANIGYAFYSKAIIERYVLNDLDNALATVQEGSTLTKAEMHRLGMDTGEGPMDSQILASYQEQFVQVQEALSRFELDIYQASPEKYEEAVAKFQQAIQDNPNDVNIYLVYANLIEHNDADGAFETYKKCIELEPNNATANFNAGANRLNKGVAFARKANEEIDFQKAGEWQEKTNEQFRLALPYLQKGNELDPENIYIIDALLQITLHLELMDEYNLYKTKREAIRGY